MKCEWHPLGEYIEPYEDINSNGKMSVVFGLNKDRAFMPTAANLEGVDLSKYKIVHEGCFVFSGMQTGRDVCIRLGLNTQGKDFLVSPAYFTFKLKENVAVLAEYIFTYFNRKESDRLGWFLSDSSIRSNLDWPRFIDIRIPVPSIPDQKKVVDAWKGLRKLKEENERLAEPLMQLCRSYMQELKKKWPMKELEGRIIQSDARNSNLEYDADAVRGLGTNKELISTKANLEGVDLSAYKVVSPKEFAYVPDTTRRGDKVSMGFNEGDSSCLVSSISTVFHVANEDELLPEYLFTWFKRSEFDRVARYNSWGSAREAFSWGDFCRVKIPLPPKEVQEAVVAVYRSAMEAKRIAAEADELSRQICPALIQHVVKGGK